MADIVPSPPRPLLEAIPGLKQVGLLIGVAAAVAAAIWLVIWSQGQNYSVLFGQLSERESGQVMDALTAAGIEYKLTPSGAVSVPEAKVQEARIRLASQGLPQSDSMGVEMIQKESALGASSMMESARYQSMLETELARTIIKVQGVESARVHLALPKPSVFLRDAHKATASVMLQLYPGRRLEPGQVAAIVHLVASSVPELAASDVTLVDQAGSLLNSPDESAEAAESTRQLEYTHKLEESYQRRIIELLEPLVGAGRVRATVTADLDFTVTEETRENYDPQKTAVRSEQTSNETRKGGDGVEGIPGALSNQPPGTAGAPVIGAGAAGTAGAPGTAPAPGAAAQSAASAGPSSSSQRSTRNFEVDRTLSYVKQPIGNLKRLSVGVVLDNWQKVEADGKVTTTPMSDTDIKRFTQLVRESIGLKDDRGDQLNVLNQAFKTAGPIGPVEGPPLWQRPEVTQIGKQLLGAGLVLLVAFLILRPLMKSLTGPPLRASAATPEPAELEGDRASLSGQAGKAIKLAPSFEQQIAAARTLVGQDPKRAAQVVKDWVAADG